MAELDGFLGQDMDLPEERLYNGARHYWVRSEGPAAQAAKAGKSSPTCTSIYSGIKEG